MSKDRDNVINETGIAKKYNKYTYSDYLSWTDDKRYELIDGVVYDMTPASLRIYQKISLKLSMQFAFNLYEKSGVRKYWLVRPQEKIVIVFKLSEGGRYGRPDIYGEEDEIEVGIFADLIIRLSEIFETE